MRLRESSLSGAPWGCSGAAAVERLQRGLNVELKHEILEFVNDVGNLRVGPFNIVLGGDEIGSFSAVTETRELWKRSSILKDLAALKLMEHAGEVYIYFSDTGIVCAYDIIRPVPGEETLSWVSFDLFLDWLFVEAAKTGTG